VTYEDIGGLAEEIQKIREMVELPLKHPELFRHLGIEPPKGVLLYGPPGCGKTLLARAVANEADANFYAINGPEITSKYYGESEAKLRNIFKKAEENAPSIIFIDEIDAIAPKREEVTGEAEKRVVSQLLTLMDGLNARGNVIVIAATNRIDAIDPALRRPGRFDREIELKVPDQRGRLEILQIHVRGMPLADDVDLEKLAEMTHGYTGADLAALCREAAMKALRRCLPMVDVEEEEIPKNILDQIAVCMDDFLKAYKEIVPTALREVEIQIPNVRWSDIGGLAEVKKKLKEAVEWPIKWPEKFRKWNITPVKGILLYGPPGTGKTLLAQALATECNLNFIAVRGSELLSKWVGESEKGVRRIFMRARLAAPSIIFFEEVEALAPKRGISVTDVMDRVISQLLTEIDGITRLSDVIVIAATNRPDLIDEALLRPGRIDLMLYTPPPNELERLEILKIHTRSFDMDEGVDLEEIARKTDYYTGADLASLCREAAMNALRRNPNANRIIMEDFLKALETIKPSLNEQIIKWYEEFQKTVRYSKFVKIPAIA
ncbi:AAA family ATPase, partial [Candidatus Geothermarchaeota archaeon]